MLLHRALLTLPSTRTFNFFNVTNLKAVRSFKSEHSLDRIYPNSTLDLSKPKPVERQDGKFSGIIPVDQLEITYSRSSGPGGQNVNKVNTKVEMRFHVASASWIPELARENILKLHKNTPYKMAPGRSQTKQMQTLNLLTAGNFVVRKRRGPPSSAETLAIYNSMLSLKAHCNVVSLSIVLQAEGHVVFVDGGDEALHREPRVEGLEGPNDPLIHGLYKESGGGGEELHLGPPS
ncbi:uncharacterized protein LOC118202254 [Stegodyphus dumicola]|uniref:uncharacterized protein LOC118202254 n=1 Tax=Stegodyphus dumicola TaxID=202533 RepID=UPI0015B1E16C|nr:uncharacterized protein LOC118202254 [Stegodyphus dumicola]